jgi:ABC-type amino acid transport substrate-binding protein
MAGMAAASCGRGAGQLRTLRVAVASTYPTMSAFYVAQEEGWFQDAGFKLDIVPAASAPRMIPLLSAGKLDVSFDALSPAFFNAVERGAHFRIVAGRDIVAPGSSDRALYGLRSSFPRGLTDLKELKRKRIAIHARAMVIEYWLDKMLARAGLTQDDVKVVIANQPEAYAALKARGIDAIAGVFFLDRAFATLESRLVLGIRVSDVLPKSQFSHVLFGEKLLSGPVETGTRFLAAYLRGTQAFARGRTPAFLVDLCRKNGWDLVRAGELCRQAISPGGDISMPSLESFADWAISKGYCAPSVRRAEWVDKRFLETARRMAAEHGA